MDPGAKSLDVAVIGAGFGGLGAALRLAERGASVALFEALRYPGGCASTFSRGPYRFESGATLFSGFAPGQLFANWIERHQLEVDIDWLDPVAQLRAPGWSLDIPGSRQELIDRLCAEPGAKPQALRAFFKEQLQVADTLWDLLGDPALLPPFGARELLRHLGRSPRYLPLLRHLGQPLRKALDRHGLSGWAPLEIYLNAVCQITVQASVDEAEAPFAMSTMDYWFRGTGHVRGGIGQLASALTGAIKRAGGQVYMPARVRALERLPQGWRLRTRAGDFLARRVVANLLPQDVRQLVQGTAPSPELDRLSQEVETGWGAVMLYRALAPGAGAPDKAAHLELVQDPARPMTEGNHLFCSVSGPQDGPRAPAGQRTMTVSTHVSLQELRALPQEQQARRVAQIQDKMRQGITALAPDWAQHTVHELTASPRTFARFTRRFGGYVGGIPRRHGLHNYRQLLPVQALPDLYLVGDTVFPGQSTLATAIGGLKLAEHLS